MDEKAAEVHLRSAANPWGDGGPGAEVRWAESDADALGYAVAAAADSGVLLMLSRSQDGGAIAVGFIDEGVTHRRWFHSVQDAVRAIEQVAEYVDQNGPRPPAPRPVAANGRPRKAPRKR